jgi:hypothetical protein
MRSRRRRPMTSPEPAPPPAPSDSARHTGACGASAAQGLSLRRDPCCVGCEGAQARARAHGRPTRRAAAATESDAVALALPTAIPNEWERAGLPWRSGRRRRPPPEGRGSELGSERAQQREEGGEMDNTALFSLVQKGNWEDEDL